MADNERSLSDLWRETLYTAHVNFLRKRGLYEQWNQFKAGKKMRKSDFRLMSQFIQEVERSQSTSE